MRKIYFLIFGIILLFSITSVSFYHFLPDNMATHWSGGSEPDEYTDKFSLVLIISFSLIFSIMLTGIGGAVFYAINGKNLHNWFSSFIILISLLLLPICVGVLLWIVGIKYNISLFSSFVPIIILGLTIIPIIPGSYFYRKNLRTIHPAKINFTFSDGIYKDRLVEMDSHAILIKQLIFRQLITGPKKINFSDIEYIVHKKASFWYSSWMCNPCPIVLDGLNYDKFFIMKLKNKWIKIKFTVESSQTVSDIFKTKGLLRQ